MPQITVSERAIRQLVNDALDNRSFGVVTAVESADAVKVNPIVDPSEPVVDPSNSSFKPQNKVEFGVAVNDMTKDLPPGDMPTLFKAVKDAVVQISKDSDKVEEKQAAEEKNKMKQKPNDKESKKVEEAVRLVVRKLVAETLKGKSKKDLNKIENELEDEEAEDEAAAVAGDEEEQGATLEKIRQELGLSIGGAARIVNKTLEKAQWLGQMLEDKPEELELLTLVAVKDYINMLKKTGELTAADIKLMQDHPSITAELDGFREYLAKVIRRARKVESDD
jgi:hypothetical protein